jgi:tyrosyl-tRNA synthetase
MPDSTKSPEINTDPELIEEVLSRSVSAVFPSKDELKKMLLGGKRLKIYHGADATGSQLHLGHSTNFILLEKFRRLGHEVFVLFGDFTAMIGDPTDKGSARVQLTKEQVEENIKTWKSQIKNLIQFDDPVNPPKIVKNSEWLSKLTFSDVVSIGSNFTVQQMIERDMFQKRLADKKPIYLHEFFYPLMQGYDSVALDVDVEIGGNDQTFNMLAGRILQRKIHNREKCVVGTTLLIDPKTNKKLMSKSEGSFVALNDTATDMYGKIMALPDSVITQMFIDCTLLSLKQINKISRELASGTTNPRDFKAELAREIVTLYHGAAVARSAEESFINTFKKGGIPDDALIVKVASGTLLVDILLEQKLIVSKADFRRLVKAGAVTVVESRETVVDEKEKIQNDINLKIGKHRFIKIVVR